MTLKPDMNLKHSLSTGLHNIISNKPPRTESLLSLFLVVVISAMSSAILVVMTKGLESDLRKEYLENNTFKAKNLTRQVDQYLGIRRTLLATQANSASVQQTVMNPDNNYGLISDYFATQTVIGERYTQQLYDFKGHVIYDSISSDPAKAVPYPAQTQTIAQRFSELYAGAKTYSLQLTPNNNFWELALPIKYGQSVEGLLITYLPVHAMVEDLALNQSTDIYLEIRTSNGQSLAWGQESDIQSTQLALQDDELTLSYAISMSNMEASFDTAKQRLLIGTVIVAIIATASAIFLGRWFFVRPLEKLQSFASQLSEGADPHLEKTKRITIEIQELSDQITVMAQKIHRREQALMQSNQALKDNQDTLVHAEKMAGLGQVTAGVAHEINNPIGFVMNNLTMLQEYHSFLKKLVAQLIDLQGKLPDDTKLELRNEFEAIAQTLQEEDLDFVINDLDCITGESIAGAERVKEITQALKGYAHSGEQVSSLDINDCIDSTLKMVWNELKYNCEIKKNYADLPLVDCIGGQISQVLMNLFVNAAHAMEGSKGILTIATRQENNQVLIDVSDTGCGIKPEHLKHIFDPFFTTKAVGQGTGLGMSICYDIIKKHGGKITVDSELGVGTNFHVSLPIPQD